MSKMGRILIAIIVVAVIAGGIFLLANRKDETTRNSSSTSQTRPSGDNATGQEANNPPNNDTAEETASSVTVTYDNNGFSISDGTLKSGGSLIILNNSREDLEFSSDPHPSHTTNPELNADSLAPGKKTTIVLTKKGTWGFHNHLNSNHTGKLTVE